jgi:hypothetical protein
LRCDDAVRLAAQALPNDHPEVMRVQFVYGAFRPTDCGGVLLQGVNETLCTHVVFTFAGGSRQYVGLYRSEDQLTVSSPWP